MRRCSSNWDCPSIHSTNPTVNSRASVPRHGYDLYGNDAGYFKSRLQLTHRWHHPHAGAINFMSIALHHNLTPEKIIALNRIRIHQQVLFLSNVLMANGKSINKKYLCLQQPLEQWSTYTWPQTTPTPSNLALWLMVLDKIAPLHQFNDQLGPWMLPTHKI